MDLRQLHRFSHRALKGHYAAAWRASWLQAGILLMRRLIPVGLALLLMVRGSMEARQVWTGGWVWIVFCILWELFCAGLLLPVRCGVSNWYGTRLGLTRRRTCFRRVRGYFRAARNLAAAELLCTLAALLPVAAGTLGFLALRESLHHPDGGMWLFAAVQAFAVMLWTGVFCIRFRAGMSAVPMLCTELPEAGIVTILRRSQKMLQGGTFWTLKLFRLPAMAACVPMLFLLPYFDCELNLFLQLRLRETAEN